jgi:hypothetical protein
MLELIGLLIGLVGLSFCITGLAIAVKGKKRDPDLILNRKEPIISDCYWTRR